MKEDEARQLYLNSHMKRMKRGCSIVLHMGARFSPGGAPTSSDAARRGLCFAPVGSAPSAAVLLVAGGFGR